MSDKKLFRWLRNFDPFRPDFSFPMAFMIFVTAGYFGQHHFSVLGWLTVFSGLLCYLIGSWIGKRIYESPCLSAFLQKKYWSIIFMASICLFLSVNAALLPIFPWWLNLIIASLCVIPLNFVEKADVSLISRVGIAGVLLSFFCYGLLIVTSGGFPLLDQELKSAFYISPLRPIFLTLYLVGFGCVVLSRKPERFRMRVYMAVLFLLGILLSFLISFLGHLLMIILFSLSLCWYCRIIGRRTLAAGALISPFFWSLMVSRANGCLKYLDIIVYYAGWYGKTFGRVCFIGPDGLVLLHSEMIKALGLSGNPCWISLASTWLGPAYLDFGIFGVALIMIYLGSLLEFGYQLTMESTDFRRKLITLEYCLLWSLAIWVIDFGPNWVIFASMLISTYLFLKAKEQQSRFLLRDS